MSGLGVSTRYSHQMEVADVNSAPVLAPDVSTECQHQGSTPNVNIRGQHLFLARSVSTKFQHQDSKS